MGDGRRKERGRRKGGGNQGTALSGWHGMGPTVRVAVSRDEVPILRLGYRLWPGLVSQVRISRATNDLYYVHT